MITDGLCVFSRKRIMLNTNDVAGVHPIIMRKIAVARTASRTSHTDSTNMEIWLYKLQENTGVLQFIYKMILLRQSTIVLVEPSSDGCVDRLRVLHMHPVSAFYHLY